MTLTLELSKDLEDALADRATDLGLSLPDYALQLLSSGSRARTEISPRTGAELVGYWEREGMVADRRDIGDSLEHARSLRRASERRQSFSRNRA